MNGGHWTDQDLINHVYGVGPEDEHLQACSECRARWMAISERRTLVLEAPEISGL